MANVRWLAAVCMAVGLLNLLGAHAFAQPLSPKRGFADVNASYGYLQAVNAGWYYGWRPDKPAGAGNFDADFVPMIWGAHQANQFEIDRILGYGDVEWVLGFNEPERPDQANIGVGDAVAAWRTLSNGFSGTDVKLISPGVADTGGADGGQQWLADFVSQVNSEGLKLDGVAFHWYGASTPNDPVGAANSFISRVDSYHNSYGLPVWITEFAIHDWGGNYSDEEVRAANAIFLENVIPRLESRSYVGGYAFYNWFGDSALVEGSPLTPTNVGVNYVGAIKQGDTYDFAGVDMGEHVAYMAGGELTRSSAATGAVRYINALSAASRISGGVDWEMTEGDWVRVQPGATLSKTGSNRIVLDKVGITNSGVIEVNGGELVLRNRPAITGAGLIRVGQGGTLRFDGAARGGPGRFEHPVELNGGTVAADAAHGGVIVGSSASLSGEGIVTGGLTAASGSVVRVGGTGLSEPAWSTIEDFQGYAPGKLNAGATAGVWTGVFDGTSNAQVVNQGLNQSLEFYGTGNSWRGAQTSLSNSFGPSDYSLANGETGTYFFRVQRQGTQTIDGIFGLTDLESIGIDTPWQELGITLSLFQGSGPGDTTALRAYNGDTGGDVVVRNNITADEWINIWLIVDNATKTFEVATSTGTDEGALFLGTFAFGRQSALGEALDTFAGAEFRSTSNPSNASVRIDDLVYLAGETLINPLSGGPPGLYVNPAVLRVEGDFELAPSALLELDIFDPDTMDKLEVTGSLVASGTLQVSLDPAAPAPAAGDAFDLLDFASASGAFDNLILPMLGEGLRWDTTSLYTAGVLAVTEGLAGDYNADGLVDARDYAVWRENFGAPAGALPNDIDGGAIGAAQFNTWQANFGASALSGTVSQPSPEPMGWLLVVIGASLVGVWHRGGK